MGELLIVGKKSIALVGEAIEDELKFTWERDHREEIEVAKKAFEEFVARGWLAIGEKDGKMTQIFVFDPTFDRIVLGPIALGG